MTTRILICDTEFTSFSRRELVSIALVSLQAHSFYALSTPFEGSNCSAFVRENVLPKAEEGQPVRGTQAELGAALEAWLTQHWPDGTITVVADSLYDTDHLEELLAGRPVWSRIAIEIIDPLLDPQGSAAYAAHFERVGWAWEHHALHDAIALASAFRDALQHHRSNVTFVPRTR